MAANSLPYTPAIRAGQFLFVSGQIGLRDGELVDGGLEAQIAQAFANLEQVLSDNGAAVTDLVKMTVFLVDMADFAVMNDLYARFFGEHLPARSTIAVSALPRGAIFEIEGVAHVGQ